MLVDSLLLILHVISAVALVGPLMLAPRWLSLAGHDVGRDVMHDLHQQTMIGGWMLLLSGLALLALGHWSLLHARWMQVSLVMYVGTQAVDHWWADRQEERMGVGSADSVTAVKCWLIAKMAVYLLILGLMVMQPSLSV